MKKGVIAVIIFIMLPLVLAVTNDCTNNNNEIFSLSNDNNAHGEIANQASYLYEICYNQIFGSDIGLSYDGVIRPETCTNPIVKLSAVTNAHAGSSYDTNVCYADLACNIKTACGGEEKAIASMSALTNAHLGKASVYENKICCFSPSARWENFKEEVISSAGLGWVVRLVYNNPRLNNGESVRFEVKEKDAISDDNIRTGDNALVATALNGKAVAEWQIVQGDLDKTSDYDKFYFKVRDRTSDFTAIDKNYRNSYPIAKIDSPYEGGIYFTGTPIVFNHNSSDAEGPVQVVWDIGDNLAEKTNKNFTHLYSQAGEKIIKLTATDSGGLTSIAQTSILVVDASANNAVYAFISSPKEGQAVVSSDLKIAYNGEGSYAIKKESSGNCVNVVCLAGNCPASTSNAPSCSNNPIISVQNSPQGYGALNFKWIFQEGSSSITDEGLGKKQGIYGYASTGNNVIELIASYDNNAIQASSLRKFTLYDQRQCISGGTLWVEISDDGREIAKHNTLSTRKCAGKDEIAGNGDDCCPAGWYCSDDESSPGCKVNNVTAILQCSNYATEVQCSNDSLRVAQNNPLWSAKGCGNTINENNIICQCKWANNQCEFSIKSRSAKEPDIIINQCVYNAIIGDCENGYQTIDVSASGGVECISSKEIVPCGKPAIELPFFSWINIILSLALTGVIYRYFFK